MGLEALAAARSQVPPVTRKRYRPGPRRRRELHVPGRSVQVDVKHLKLGGRRCYQFTAIDEATRYRVLRVYAHNSIRSATDFVDELRRRFPAAIQRIQTDHGSEFGTDSLGTSAISASRAATSHAVVPKATGRSSAVTEQTRRKFYRRTIFRSPAELAAKLRQWEHEYSYRRPHLALRGSTPAEQLCELRLACDRVRQLA
jgi:transposase InsO family protein